MFKPPDNKTDRFKGAIHKLRKRLSCSAIDLPRDDTSPSATPPTSSPSPAPTLVLTPAPELLPPCEWFGGAFRHMAVGATKHVVEERYRIAMEIERGPREELWGLVTFYSTSTIELELTASRIRDFKEGRYG